MAEYPSASWKDYELLDSGAGEKLERFGAYVLARPEPKALWGKSLSEAEWRRLAHTSFTPGAGFGKAGKEDSGTWNRLRKMDDQWYIRYMLPGTAQSDSGRATGLVLRLGLTSFKHVGVFPEQAPNWDYIYRQTTALRERLGRTPRVLNLFAYTGAASLAAKAAGADVTHLDSVRQVVTWARGNMENSGMDGIRWIVEDAMKFARREERRGNRYDGIILDPPAYGHGPDGEKWKLDECLFDMLCTVGKILSPVDAFLVLNLYSNGYSALLGETVVRQAMSAGALESGELALNDRFGKALPLSIVVRMTR
ncbi:MAG: class I SAM-dependent methyltransferase [Bacteroidales bacterium]|nr:class I SAM-dependent methyltransferase [Bacteroidales bacterium]MBO6238425.1 class I SAM-dependent methyltransferase [Bacteroidales bacterium]